MNRSGFTRLVEVSRHFYDATCMHKLSPLSHRVARLLQNTNSYNPYMLLTYVVFIDKTNSPSCLIPIIDRALSSCATTNSICNTG